MFTQGELPLEASDYASRILFAELQEDEYLFPDLKLGADGGTLNDIPDLPAWNPYRHPRRSPLIITGSVEEINSQWNSGQDQIHTDGHRRWSLVQQSALPLDGAVVSAALLELELLASPCIQHLSASTRQSVAAETPLTLIAPLSSRHMRRQRLITQHA